MKIIYFSFPVNAPWASTTVALRFSSFTMKSQIGCGSSHTTLKYFERLKLSMKLSIMKERTASPRKEYSPVLMSNTKHPATVIRMSDTSNAFPISKLLYFLIIIAMISVPPLDEPILKRMAEPSAGSAIAKQSSNIVWSVRGWVIGQTRSKTESATESRILQ